MKGLTVVFVLVLVLVKTKAIYSIYAPSAPATVISWLFLLFSLLVLYLYHEQIDYCVARQYFIAMIYRCDKPISIYHLCV